MRVAAHEYLATQALDDRISTPTYERYFDGLHTTVAAGAANVLCAGRLLARPDAFRMCTAWSRQAAGTRHAQNAYVAALRGQPGQFSAAQLIIVTRLMRAIAAITLLDIRQDA